MQCCHTVTLLDIQRVFTVTTTTSHTYRVYEISVL